MKNLPVIIGAVIILLFGIGGFLVYQKSQVKPAQPPAGQSDNLIKKVDLGTQPAWVQKLDVNVKKGKSANGLDNVTVTVKGLPAGLVTKLNYVLQYQTTNKGTQGALSTKPLDINGATTWTKTIELGTCSTKSCVRHEGVTSVDLELDFTTSSDDTPVWEKPLDLK